MLKSETARLLQMCAAYDLRTVGEADVEAWHAVICGLTFDTCREAVIEHYSDSAERIMPSHVRAIATRKGETFTPKTPALPDADPDDVPAWLEAMRSGKSIELEPGPGLEPRRLASVLKSLKDAS